MRWIRREAEKSSEEEGGAVGCHSDVLINCLEHHFQNNTG